MRRLIYSKGVSLDGYIVGPDGDFGFPGGTDDEVFRFVTNEIRGLGVSLLGRRLYETMLYSETASAAFWELPIRVGIPGRNQ